MEHILGMEEQAPTVMQWDEFVDEVNENSLIWQPAAITTWQKSVLAWETTDKLYARLMTGVKEFASHTIYGPLSKEGQAPKTFGKNQDGSDQKLPVMIEKLAACGLFREKVKALTLSGTPMTEAAEKVLPTVQVKQKFMNQMDPQSKTWVKVPVRTAKEMQSPISIMDIQAYMLAMSDDDYKTYRESVEMFHDLRETLSNTFDGIKSMRKVNGLTPPDMVEKTITGTLGFLDKIGESALKAVNNLAEGSDKPIFGGTVQQFSNLTARFTGKKQEKQSSAPVSVYQDDNQG
jgi:hypothetical protein